MLKLINYKGLDIYQYPLEEKSLDFLKGFIENYIEDKQNGDQNEAENNKKQKDDCIFNLRQGFLDLKMDKQIDHVKNGEQHFNNLIEKLLFINSQSIYT
jgi:hypothetical protein